MNRIILIAIVCGFIAAPTMADLYGFRSITNNNAANAATGEVQLSVDVTATGINQVSFEFMNAGPLPSSITDVYFDNGALLNMASIINGPGVDFEQYASPGNLPGGNGIDFETTAGLSADSRPPTQPNGVNPGEWVKIIFDLQDGMNFGHVTSQLGTGELRIGIHVQGFADGGSESFVNVVPAPAAVLFGMLGLGAAGVRLRRFV